MITKTGFLLMVIISIFVLVVLGCEDNTELIDKLTTDNSRLQADVTQLTVGMAGIQANLKELEVERDGLKAELSSLQGNQDDVLEEHDRLKKEIEGLEKVQDDVLEERDDLKREIRILQEDQDDVIGKRDDLKEEIVELDGKIANVKKLIARLEENAAAQKHEVEELTSQLQDKDARIRSIAAEALGVIGEGASDAVPLLIPLLQDKDKNVHNDVVWALGQIGSKDAVPALISNLKIDKDFSRGLTVNALAEIGEDAVPDLIEALKGQGIRVRYNVAIVLGKIGEGASKAVPALINALQDQDAYIVVPAIDALESIGIDGMVPDLIEVLEDQMEVMNGQIAGNKSFSWEVCVGVANLLRSVGGEGKDAVPVLIQMLQICIDKGVFGSGVGTTPVVRALGSIATAIGEGAVDAAPLLIQILFETYMKEIGSRVSGGLILIVTEVLGAIGEGALAIDVRPMYGEGPDLIDFLRALDVRNGTGKDTKNIAGVMEALQKMGTPEALEAVEKAKRQEDPFRWQ